MDLILYFIRFCLIPYEREYFLKFLIPSASKPGESWKMNCGLLSKENSSYTLWIPCYGTRVNNLIREMCQDSTLVIDRANAGKTTQLKWVCNTCLQQGEISYLLIHLQIKQWVVVFQLLPGSSVSLMQWVLDQLEAKDWLEVQQQLKAQWFRVYSIGGIPLYKEGIFLVTLPSFLACTFNFSSKGDFAHLSGGFLLLVAQ